MADRIQRKTKKQRYVPLELLVEGDALLFRYPNSVTFKHFVYDDVDFASPIYVESVRTGLIVEKMFVAVSFTLDSNRTVWTNYSKESFKYMVKVR